MHITTLSRGPNTVKNFITRIPWSCFVLTLMLPAFLLCSCANPYSSLYGDSPSRLKEDINFLDRYKQTVCDIKEQHEYGEISTGKCLALYYDCKEDMNDEKDDVVQRISYVYKHPDKVDQSTLNTVSEATVAIAGCLTYITENCMY